MSADTTLVLGWGNPGRLDDGLGPALARAVGELGLPGVTADDGYQLQVEDSADVARYDRVVFVDADRGGGEPFSLRRLSPALRVSFTTHSVSPASVLALARDLFHAQPEAWLLGIRGYQFDDFGERLSVGARANLSAAIDYLRSALGNDHLDRYEPTPASSPISCDERGAPCKTAST